MSVGASNPEELESLLEDAFVTGDPRAAAQLFDDGAVLLTGSLVREAHGNAEIERRTAALCNRGYSYIADPRQVLRSRDTTLVIAGHAVNVMRRGRDGRWLYAISMLNSDNPSEGAIQ